MGSSFVYECWKATDATATLMERECRSSSGIEINTFMHGCVMMLVTIEKPRAYFEDLLYV